MPIKPKHDTHLIHLALPVVDDLALKGEEFEPVPEKSDVRAVFEKTFQGVTGAARTERAIYDLRIKRWFGEIEQSDAFNNKVTRVTPSAASAREVLDSIFEDRHDHFERIQGHENLSTETRNALQRLAEQVRRANALQHSGKPLTDDDWADLHQLTNEAFGVLEKHKATTSPTLAAETTPHRLRQQAKTPAGDIKLKIDTSVPLQHIADALDAAWNAEGVGRWGSIASYKVGEPRVFSLEGVPLTLAAFSHSGEGGVKIKDEMAGHPLAVHTLGRLELMDGLRALGAKAPATFRRIQEGDLDTRTGDLLVQYALFQEERY